MVRKMADPHGPGATALAEETGVSQSTLYRWVSETDIVDVADVSDHPSFSKSMQRMSNVKRPHDWSPEEKLAAVLEAISLSEEDLGAYLRSRELHEAHLQQWHDQMLCGLEPLPGKRAEQRLIKSLEKELQCKQKALAEAAALLVLKKSPTALGGRGRRHHPVARKQVLVMIDEVLRCGARLRPAARMLGLTCRTVQRWRSQSGGYDRRNGPKTSPANKLTATEN